MSEEMDAASLENDYDDLTAITGIGSTFADALYEISIRRFAVLAQHTPESLADALRQTEISVSPERIKNENWIGQARAKVGLAHNTEVNNNGEPPIFVFFEPKIEGDDEDGWQTRVYDGYSGDEKSFSVEELAKWVNWILEHSRLPPDVAVERVVAEAEVKSQAKAAAQALATVRAEADIKLETARAETAEAVRRAEAVDAALSQARDAPEIDDVSVEVKAVDVFKAEPAQGAQGEHLMAKVSFSIEGSDAHQVAAEALPCRIEVYVVNRDTGDVALISHEQHSLEAEAPEYSLQNKFAMPGPGRYEVRTVVLLFSLHKVLAAAYCGPAIRIVQAARRSRSVGCVV